MAGTITSVKIEHRARGVTKSKVTWLADASGDASATVLGVGYGRLVGIGIPLSAFSFGDTIFTLTDAQSGASLMVIDTLGLVATADKFASTTTGDDSGGVTEDLFTTGAVHGLTIGDRVTIISKTGGTLPTVGVTYFVIAEGFTTTTFELSATSGGASINMGSDISAMTWLNQTNWPTNGVPKYFRPSAAITDNVGVAVAPATTAVDVNRDIFVAGKLSLTVAQGGNLGTGRLDLVIDETDIADRRY